ncbi:MAG: SpoIIE family protein phosphatase, partial [Candidatus Scalindua sp.]
MNNNFKKGNLERVALKMSTSLELQEVLTSITQGLVDEFDASFARIWLLGPGDLCPKCCKADSCISRKQCLHLEASAGIYTRINGEYRRIPLGAFKIGRIAQGDGPISTNDALGDDRIPNKKWLKEKRLRSFAGHPLIFRDELLGVLAMFSRRVMGQEEFDWIAHFANQAAVAIKNARLFEENLEKGRMEEELKIAHDLQVSMLPDKPPEIEGIKIAASSIAAREVGGDFYDFIEIGRDEGADKLGIVIGDVSGKGVPGSLMMAASRSIYRVLAEENPSVEKVMSIGNYSLNRDIRKGMFVALIYAVYEPGEKTLTLSNAGQTQPIICNGGHGNPNPFYIDTEGDKFPLG